MNCFDFSRALARQESFDLTALSPQAREHLRACPRCAELSALLNPQLSDEPLRPEFARALESKLSRNLIAVKPLASTNRFTGLFIASFAAIAIASGSILGSFGLEVLATWQIALIFCILAAAGVLLARSLATQMSPGGRSLIEVRWLLPGTLLVLLVLFPTLFPWGADADFWEGHVCFSIGISVSIPSAIVYWVLLRHGGFLAPQAAGATAGLLAGLTGVAALEIHCPILTASHIDVFHGAVALTTLAAGFMAGALMGGRRQSRQ